MATVAALLRAGSEIASDSPRRDAEILLCHCVQKPRVWLYTWPEREVSSACEIQYQQLIAQRQQGVPVAYLVGEREFWSLSLNVSSATLIPRPETETLISWALELVLPKSAMALDLGTGSGAIALALASERPQWAMSAVDSSAEALAVARSNGVAAGLPQVTFTQSNWYEALNNKHFDLLLANPPYIDSDDPHLERGDLRFEPRSALVAADSGLADLKTLVSGAPEHLNAGGWLLLEHGFEQGEAVRTLLHETGFSEVGTRRDMAGQERISGGCWRVG